jgi:hypothetical protein
MLLNATVKKLQKRRRQRMDKRVKEVKEKLSPLIKDLPKDVVPKTLLLAN